MENLKIKATAETASEIIDLLEANGSELAVTKEILICEVRLGYNILVDNGRGMFSAKDNYPVKEITLPQLRDMVVLKRNSIEDATHIRGDGKKYFHAKSTDYFYQFSNDGEWLLSTWMNYQLLPQLKPIEKPMKEWLNTETYEYKKAVDMGGHSKWIEIPEGAIKLVYSITNNNHYHFVNNKNKLMSLDDINNNDGYWYGNAEEYISSLLPSVVWQRHTQPEELPFVDDEPSLNDQYAEIEKVRQSKIDETLAERQAQYGCFEDVAFVTESIMGILSKVRGNGLQDLPHPHRMALYMIASKMARIVNGDFNSIDGWHDISGYATLIERLIGGDNV